MLATLPELTAEASEAVQSIEEVAGTWWSVYCRSQQEKAFAARLERFGVPVYLPITERPGTHAGKRTIVREPTFRGYCFFATRADATADDMEIAREPWRPAESRQVIELICVKDQRRFVKELAQVKRALEINPALGSCMYLVPGTRVRVVKGPYIGFEGILESHSKGTFHVPLSIMQSSIEVKFTDESYLEPLD